MVTKGYPILPTSREGALATLGTWCKRWVYLGTVLVTIATIKRPPGKNKNYPEATGTYRQPLKKTLGRQVL